MQEGKPIIKRGCTKGDSPRDNNRNSQRVQKTILEFWKMMRTIQKRDLKDQARYQEMEILLSHDFEKLGLAGLVEIETKYINLQENGETLHWSSEQYKAWQFLYFCKTKIENSKDRAKINDVFHSSWGYDQTNTEYYKIVEISKTGKTAKVVQVAAVSIGDEKKNARDMCESIVADPKTVIDSRKQLVKIERAHTKNPYTEKAEGIGEIQLRGSVFIGTDENSSKHLTTLTRVKGQNYRSWYA
jgi:hypothetical protein